MALCGEVSLASPINSHLQAPRPSIHPSGPSTLKDGNSLCVLLCATLVFFGDARKPGQVAVVAQIGKFHRTCERVRLKGANIFEVRHRFIAGK